MRFDWVPFVLICVSLGEGLYRLLCVHIHRSSQMRERKKRGKEEKNILVQCSMGGGTINGGCNGCAVF